MQKRHRMPPDSFLNITDMQKKFLALSLFLLVGAGCTSTATVDTTVDTTTDTPATDNAAGTSPESDTTDVSDTEGIILDVAVDADADVVVNTDMDADTVAFTVTGNNFAFAPSTMTVKKGDTVTVTFKNSDGFHDFVIDELSGAKTSKIKGGEEETITFVADKAGSFEYYCSVGEHRAMGMVGTLIVTE